MRALFVVALSVCSALLLSTADSQAAPVASAGFLRLVVLDISGSMAGDRLTTAKEELLELGRQFPPSKDSPIVVVLFADTAHKLGPFTDPGAYQRGLKAVVAEGGTSIAAGLKQAIAELEKSSSTRQVCVLLYTDGDDPDQAGITEQEAALDRLFGKRLQHGLKQSVVFCKRWGGANADLVLRIQKRGKAQVIDGAELKLLPVTVTPLLKPVRVAWASAEMDQLTIKFQAAITVQGKAPIVESTELHCRFPGATGDVRLALVPGDIAREYTISVPLIGSFDREPLVIEFEVHQPQPLLANGRLLVPAVPGGIVRLPVDLPPIDATVKLAGSVRADSGSRWVDPLARCVSIPVQLELAVQAPARALAAKPLIFGINTVNGDAVIGQPEIRVSHSGQHRLSIEVRRRVTLSSGSATAPIVLLVKPIAPPPDFRIQPSDLTLELAASLPPPVSTSLATRIVKLLPPRWIDLVRGLAVVEAEVDFQVNGPLEPSTHLSLRCPTGVTGLTLNPSVVYSGTQRVKLAATFEPRTLARPLLSLVIVPPTAQGAVQIVATNSLEISVAGLARPQVALAQHGRLANSLEISVEKSGATGAFLATPVLVGIPDPSLARGITVVCRLKPPLGPTRSDPLQLFTPARLSVNAPLRSADFFHDTRWEGEISIEPAKPLPTIVGSRCRLIVLAEAPFKRFAFYLVAALAVVLTICFFARLGWKLTTIDPT